ncbi:MAG: hypothetical protein AAF604_07865 [Acidobacteriota bacterium]
MSRGFLTSNTVEALPGLFLVPVIHGRLESAYVVRRVLDLVDPAAVAIELPTTLAEAAEKAARRLPRISLVVSEEPGEAALVWTAFPGEPFAEGLRWALERDRQIACCDPDLPYRSRHRDPIPDPWALWELPEEYLTKVAATTAASPPGEDDGRREAGMAHHLQRRHRELAGAPLVALVGAAHLEGLRRRLPRPAAIPLARTRRRHVSLRHLHPRSLTALLQDPPLAHAAWELLRGGEIPPAPPLSTAAERWPSLRSPGLRLVPAPRQQPRDRRLVLAQRAAAASARQGLAGIAAADRQRLGSVVWEAAAQGYSESSDEQVAPWQRRVFGDFARRYARCQGQLVPGLYEWVVAARGVADDNFAWEVFEAARAYPWQDETAEIETAEVNGDELDLGTRKVRFRRRFLRVKQRPLKVPVKERPKDGHDQDWRRAFRPGAGICSYPPEDLVVEDWGRYMRARAEGLLSAENARSEPFATSLLDGLDLRETLRRPDDGRLWVRELRRAPGQAGSVVAIFDRDPGNRYPYQMTWLGEHDDESDMAFYSTHPADRVVGPGILRATYGGFVMTVPPGRLFDVWQDPDYRNARDKAEVLILAAIDYSEDPLVVHIARKPPDRRLQAHAGARGKRLVHLPLGSLSPAVLKKIRVLHILDGHDRRPQAGRYIW